MVEIFTVVGVAGSGKTSHGMSILEQKLKDGLPWHQIGYSSFSRAACMEASERASKLTGVDVGRLHSDGFYRTLHSAALRLLGVSAKMIVEPEKKEGRDWFNEALGVQRGGEPGTLAAKYAEALDWWDYARATLSLMHGSDLETPIHYIEPETSASFIKHNNNSSTITKNYYKRCTQNWPIGGGGVLFQKSNTLEKLEKYGKIIADYEAQKRYSGRLDFTDILFRYAGIEVDSELMFREGYPNGSTPDEIQVWMVDEYQDCSALLDRVAQRLSENAQELWLLGDEYQAVYGFAGSDAKLFAHRVSEAKVCGNALLLNRTWRNPESVVEWGEAVLREDSGYEERSPISECGEGSVGMIQTKDLTDGLDTLATKDTMILARAWFALGKIKSRLDEMAIPWRSCQEKQSSRWECPVKIAIVLTMRAMMAGERISQQDWRRICKELPQKMEGTELFIRGTKAKWAKMECSGENVMELGRLSEWGASDGFTEWVLQERWRRYMMLLIDVAIEKYGIDVVRRPRIQIGSCHSVKGMQAANVFCLATSSKKSAESDPYEEICLKYVTITRASKNFRVVVDLYEHAQGKPLFLPCPKDYWTFEEGLPKELGDDNSGFSEGALFGGGEGESNSRGFSEEDQSNGWSLGSKVSGRDLREGRDSGCSSECDGSIRGDRVQGSGEQANADSIADAEEDSFDWLNI